MSEERAERPPPHDALAEASVLGSVCLDPQSWPAVAARLSADDFWTPEHATVWLAIESLMAEDGVADLVTLADRLRARGELEQVGGAPWLADLLESVPSAANAEAYAAVVAERAARRRALAAAAEMARLAVDDAEPLGPVLDDVRATCVSIGERLAGTPAWDIGQAAEAIVRALDAEESGNMRWSSGIATVDELTGGLVGGSHWVVAGRSRHGKTCVGCGMTLSTLDAGGGVLHARYEEQPEAILRRLVSLCCGLPYADAQTGRLSAEDAERFAAETRRRAEAWRGRLAMLVGPSRAEIEARVREMRPWLVVVDTLQKMAQRTESAARRDRHDLHVGSLTAWLAGLALQHGCCVVTLSQVGRQSGNGMPRVGHLRESTAIEEDADAILMVWWPKLDRARVAEDPNHARGYVIDVAKNRLGGRVGRTWNVIEPATGQLAVMSAGQQSLFEGVIS